MDDKVQESKEGAASPSDALATQQIKEIEGANPPDAAPEAKVEGVPPITQAEEAKQAAEEQSVEKPPIPPPTLVITFNSSESCLFRIQMVGGFDQRFINNQLAIAAQYLLERCKFGWNLEFEQAVAEQLKAQARQRQIDDEIAKAPAARRIVVPPPGARIPLRPR